MAIAIAIHKAKRMGRHFKFFISTPAGMYLAKIIPRLDNISRLLFNAMVAGDISHAIYIEHNDILNNYLLAVDDFLLNVVKIAKKVKRRLRKNRVRYELDIASCRRKDLYLNMQDAINLLHTAIQIDKCFRIMLIAQRYDAISTSYVVKEADKLNKILQNLEAELTKMGVMLWQMKNSSV
jgi:hypothetical protein